MAEIPGRRHKLVRTQSLNCSFLYSIWRKTTYFGRFCRLIKTKRNLEYDLFLRKASKICINFRNSLKLCKLSNIYSLIVSNFACLRTVPTNTEVLGRFMTMREKKILGRTVGIQK